MKYFTSDLHFNHNKIIDFCPGRVKSLGMDLELYEKYKKAHKIFREAPKPKCPVIKAAFFKVRDELIQNHNECLVARINKKVKKRDILYIIGDYGFGNVKDLKYWFQKLNGMKILILGNHDRDARVMLAMGFHAVFENHYIDICEGKQRVYMSHFPYFPNWYLRLRHWILWRKNPDKRYLHKRIYDVGNILLHGHTHDSYITQKYNRRQIHVGIDAWGEAVSEKQIMEVIERYRK